MSHFPGHSGSVDGWLMMLWICIVSLVKTADIFTSLLTEIDQRDKTKM